MERLNVTAKICIYSTNEMETVTLLITEDHAMQGKFSPQELLNRERVQHLARETSAQKMDISVTLHPVLKMYVHT